MDSIRRLLHYVKPYWKLAALALLLLTSLVFMDLAIPRLIQNLIDQGIKQNNLSVVINTSLIMLGISLLSTVIAVGNSNLSVLVGESTARDLRKAIFVKIQQFSYSNLDQYSTGTTSYTVVSGDTLSNIALNSGISLAALEAANPQITTPALIYAGQVINLPSSSVIPITGGTPAVTPVPGTSTYTVVSGDSLSSIAASHGVTLSALEAANPQITTPSLIFAGNVISIP